MQGEQQQSSNLWRSTTFSFTLGFMPTLNKVQINCRSAAGSRKVSIILPDAELREGLARCAEERDQLAVECLETIRRIEAGEPVGVRYAEQLNEFMKSRQRRVQ